MPGRQPWRGVEVAFVERPSDEGEAWPSGYFLSAELIELAPAALARAIETKDDELPGMEILAARLGTPGTTADLARKRRNRDALWALQQFFEKLRREFTAMR